MKQREPARVEMKENFHIFFLFLSPYSVEKAETLILASWEQYESNDINYMKIGSQTNR